MILKKTEQKTKTPKTKKWVLSVIAAMVIFSAVCAGISYLDLNYVRKNKSTSTKNSGANSRFTFKNIGSTADVEDKITQFDLSISKIGVFAPVVANVDGASQNAYNEALKGGVAHFAGTALPGAGSNIFVFGHSSSIYGTGKYDKIFAKLDNLAAQDIVSINFNGKKYDYAVKLKKVILATDTSVLSPTENEQLTLMTCWPVGADQKRLIIVALPTK